MERAKKTDSGEYTCSVSQFSTTAVHIHVLNGKLNKTSLNARNKNDCFLEHRPKFLFTL